MILFMYPVNSQSIEVKVMISFSDFVITSLDALFECSVYKVYNLSDLKDCQDEKVLSSFAILALLRKKIESIIGLQDEIVKYILDGKWEDFVKFGGNEEKEFEELLKVGYSVYDLKEEIRRVLLFSEKLKDTLGIDSKSFVEFSYNYVVYGENFLENLKLNHEKRVQMKIIYDFVKSFIGAGLKF